jgi:uncharacterized protein
VISAFGKSKSFSSLLTMRKALSNWFYDDFPSVHGPTGERGLLCPAPPDVEGADPGGNRDTVVAQKLGAALFAELGMDSPVPVGSFFDVFPLSVLTTSTLAQLGGVRPQSRFDQRRFRMNVIVKTERPGFVENSWVGQKLALGDGPRLSVALPDPRCVMTTLAQDGLPQDTNVLRTLVRHNKEQVGDLGQFPCAGVYAVVAEPGTARIGDRVVLN